jgi:HTH-type transcriptional regulator / antitoxin HigA
MTTDYQAALNRAGVLMSCNPNTPEADELEVLTTLIELYEDEYFPIGLPDPIAAIEFRLEQLDKSEKDLAPIFGSENLVSEVMAKRQPLTLEMIRVLHHHFGIPADVLLQ